MQNNYIDTLFEFLQTPLESGDKIIEKFASLPDAVVGKGPEALQRYVYIPGKVKNGVVLVAHTDTVWDKEYKKPFTKEHRIIFEDGIFKSAENECGIGADDRAGCAMLWELRNSGYSLLITDGEEFGKHGAKYLRKRNRKLFRKINKHSFLIELDWKGTDCCLFNQVDNTEKFKSYIEQKLGFCDSKANGGTDLQILCKKVCGVNIGIGYHKWHSNEEYLVLSEWENTLSKLESFLKNPQPKFRTLFWPRHIRFIKRCINKALRILKIKK